jgi:predicted nucleic acid-binding protein
MNDRYFLDTNVLVYAFSRQAPEKQSIADSLIMNALASGLGTISFQVVQEFLNVARRKFQVPMKTDEALAYLHDVLMPLCFIMPSEDLYASAMTVSDRWGYSFFDSLIISAARTAGCRELLSEDLQHGQKIGDLTIRNPFSTN